MPPLTIEPATWASLERAAGIIQRFSAGITVWGHDDLDGITSAAIILRALRRTGRQADYHIPPRSAAHHGLDVRVLEDLLGRGTRLLITVDCGISNRSEVAAAKGLGIKVVVTDHHEPPEEIPGADALVNPKLPEEPRPTPELAGCGVALYLSTLLRGISGGEWLEADDESLAWAALGTVSDRVPLVAENRAIVRAGLSFLAGNRTLSEAAETAGIDLSPGLSPLILRRTLAPLLGQGESEGFRHRTLELLLGKPDPEWIKRSKKMLVQGESELGRQFARLSQNLDPSLPFVLSIDRSLRPEMAGALASRLRDETGCPAVVAAEKGGLLTGECRSLLPFDCVEFLGSMAGLFQQHGGHRQAAGFTVAPGAEEDFARLARDGLERRRGLMSRPQAQPVPKYTFRRLADVLGIKEELAEAAPFGPGNPMPLASFEDACLSAGEDTEWWPISRLLDNRWGKGRPGPGRAFLDITHAGEIIISTKSL
jgi:single-stranded-DNA-specific exonuclease